MKEHQTIMATRKTKMKRWFTRKWLYSAMYAGIAVVFFTVMWVVNHQPSEVPTITTEHPVTDVWSNRDDSDGVQGGSGMTAMDANDHASTETVEAVIETMQWPVDLHAGIKASLNFYNSKETEPAIIRYENTFRAHVGTDFINASKPQQTFDVQAARSGIVETIKDDPLTGKTVVLDHGSGVKTIYYSLADTTLKSGDSVKQGQLLGTAGRNELEKSEGIHVHFEVQKNGKPVDPATEVKE